MKLTTGIYHNKVFQLAKSFGVSHRVCDDVNKKTLKRSQKINCLSQFRPFLNTSKNCRISDASSCLSSLVKNVGCLMKNPAKSSLK